MGGKSYYCDYCCCFMKNDLNVRKSHNAGIAHCTAKATYMRRFENPRKILEEERMKIPCKRFFTGYCKFQALCKFGHFNPKQMQQLEKIVSKLKKKQRSKRKKMPQLKQNLPPSLQSINLTKLKQSNLKSSWG
ncbi:zinc finger matrin-type protein 5 [Drosophila sulfurigaster albostrigata]|uniref:zinc finger matrin-type protein 5 n=1 Tax=Drosophila sulfurigaster albostrigata TaxID=89887 RepID=UPI002D21EB91|nr:zinc finger matrin-type protein 5 [Drosophila sulfurigaster albostrigata]